MRERERERERKRERKREREREEDNSKNIFIKFIEVFRILKSILKHPLNKNQKFKSIFKFFTWTLARLLLSKKEITVPWIENSKFIIGVNEIQLRWNVYWGMVEFEDMGFLIHCLQKKDIFIDCGANVGIYTILASKVIGAKSISFEPHPKTAERFLDQISINRINHLVSLKQKAVGSTYGKLSLVDYGDTGSVLNKILTSTDKKNNKSIEVDVTTLDQEIKNEIIDNKNYIIKIDVEGYELDVIKGGKNLLQSERLLGLIVENNSKELSVTRKKIHQTLLSHNLFPITYNPFTKTLAKKENIFQTLNTIYIKDFEKIQKICSTSKKFRVHTANIYI